MIVKVGSKWVVKSKDGKTLGTHDTEDAAKAQLAAVEAEKANNEQVVVNVRAMVDNSKIRREMHNGREHIVVPSYTLPDGVVMNGGMYPAEEIAKSYKSLEGTLAPIGHPQVNGEYVASNSPDAINAHHVGAWNRNVSRKNGRVYVEKWIDVETASSSEKGKRLLDAINTGKPIHTSTGILLAREPVSNANGYDWIARNMNFDHDAILLDEPGAAGPEQGVGMMVNSQRLMVINSDLPEFTTDSESLLIKAVNKILSIVSNRLDSNEVFTPNNESIDGDTYMKDQIVAALNAAGVKTEGLDDAALFAAHNKMVVADAVKAAEGKIKVGFGDSITQAVNAAIKPLQEQLQANSDAEIAKMREVVKEKHGELIANALAGEALADMYSKCQVAAGLVGGSFATNGAKDVNYADQLPD